MRIPAVIRHSILTAALLFPSVGFAQDAREPFTLDLYQGTPPGGVPLTTEPENIYQKPGDPIVRVDHVQKPDIRVFLPAKEKNTGAAVVICPGGAYAILAIDHEGYQIARMLNSFGVAGIVCKYRVSKTQPGLYKHPIPLLDARQAMRLTRQHSAEWGIDSKRVGILGFSAGGHLASCVDTLFDARLPGEDEAVFKTMSHKPDFGVLVYPVISMSEQFGHRGSRDNLLGREPDAKLIELMDTDKHVTKHTPPTFLVSTFDDSGVPPLNAMAFYAAMCKAGVPGELHIWEKGGHGYGILPDRGDVAKEWGVRLKKWLAGRGLLGKKAQ